jgi:hypothetical protein
MGVWVGAWKVCAPQRRVRVESIGSADHLGRVIHGRLRYKASFVGAIRLSGSWWQKLWSMRDMQKQSSVKMMAFEQSTGDERRRNNHNQMHAHTPQTQSHFASDRPFPHADL